MLNVNALQLETVAFGEGSVVPKKQLLEVELNKLSGLTNSSEKMTNTLEMQTVFATPKGVTEALMAASVHQTEIVAQMMSSNPEDSISLALAASIEAYGEQLEAINAWTEGGSAVVGPLLSEMADVIFIDGVEGTEYEDLVQIMIIDMMIHDDLPDGWELKAGYFLESAGSGAHSPMTACTPEELELFMAEVYEYSLTLPPDRLAYQVASKIYPDGFYEYQDQFAEHYWTNPEGFVDGFNGDSDSTPTYDSVEGSTRLSPFLKLVLIGTASSKGELSAEDFDALAKAQTVEEAKEILGLPIDQNMTEWINDNADRVNSWEGTGKDGVNGDGQTWWDFPGAGINYSYVETLFTDFPSRELTENEIEEVNRIGDQVKMLQQTLLYWLKTCKDEQMAIAQNT